jgi:uncharacterized iron-regulated membrane protein
MSCLTGLPLIFARELFAALHHPFHPRTLPANAPLARLDDMIVIGRNLYPWEHVLSLVWDDDEPRTLLNMARSYDPKPYEDHTIVFDAHTGKVLEDSLRDSIGRHDFEVSFVRTMYTLHANLFAKLPGGVFLGCIAFTFLVALLSGALVYGPFMRRLNFGTVRKDRSTRLKWFDLHNLIGIVTLSWAVVVGATGVINTLSDPLFDLWTSQTMPSLLAPYRNLPTPTELVSVDGAAEIARRALPQMNVASVGFPNPHDGRPRDYIIWTRGKTPLTSQLYTPLLVDAGSGELMQARGLPWYLRMLELSRPLHFGDYGGTPLKVIWALFDVALIGVLLSGLYLRLSRRKTPAEAELNRLMILED